MPTTEIPETSSASSYTTSCSKNQSVQPDNKQAKIEAYSENRHVPGGKIPNLGKWILRQLMALGLILLIDVGIPLALYYGLRNVLDVLYSLIISGIPPFLWVIYGFIRHRRIDALGLIIGLSFIVSGVISMINGDARIAILREAVVTAVVGTMFLVTLIPIRCKWLTMRPMAYTMFRQMVFSEFIYRWIDKDGKEQEMGVAEWQWEHVRQFRISMFLQTAMWGILLDMELVAAVLMVKSSLTLDQVVAYNNIITSLVVALQIVVSIAALIYSYRVSKRIGAAWTRENDYTDYYSKLNNDSSQINQANDLPSYPIDNGDARHHYTDHMA